MTITKMAEGPSMIGINRNKHRVVESVTVRPADNGFILSAHGYADDKYVDIELVFTKLPQVLRAVGTFLKEGLKDAMGSEKKEDEE